MDNLPNQVSTEDLTTYNEVRWSLEVLRAQVKELEATLSLCKLQLRIKYGLSDNDVIEKFGQIKRGEPIETK
jgi:hypothetical protein